MDKKAAIDRALLKVYRRRGVAGLTREAVAAAANVSPGLVSYYVGDVAALHTRAVELAIYKQDGRALCYGLLERHKAVRSSPISRTFATQFLSR